MFIKKSFDLYLLIKDKLGHKTRQFWRFEFYGDSEDDVGGDIILGKYITKSYYNNNKNKGNSNTPTAKK